MSKELNDLAGEGYDHALNNTKKINAFEQGLKDLQAIHLCIILKKRWNNFLRTEQTFDIFYH